jgi:uncharacterized protein DUF6883
LKLPNCEEAVVPEAKILDYLLSSTHSIGRDKAAFFLQFGFSRERWRELAAALRTHAARHEVASAEDSKWGKKYSIIGALDCPDGRAPAVRSVWFVKDGETVPTLITAYPE